MHRAIHDPLHRAVRRGYPEQVGDAGQQNEEVDGESTHKLARRFAGEHTADDERHDDGDHAEIDGPRGADHEDRHESEDTGEVNGHVRVGAGAASRARPCGR